MGVTPGAVPSGALRGTATMEHVRVYFSPDYAMAATEWDTTRKARWVAVAAAG